MYTPIPLGNLPSLKSDEGKLDSMRPSAHILAEKLAAKWGFTFYIATLRFFKSNLHFMTKLRVLGLVFIHFG